MKINTLNEKLMGGMFNSKYNILTPILRLFELKNLERLWNNSSKSTNFDKEQRIQG